MSEQTPRRGGPLARLSGRMCGNPRFQALLGTTCADDAAAALRRRCGITSRRDLDSNPEAARVFHELRRAFAYQDEA